MLQSLTLFQIEMNALTEPQFVRIFVLTQMVLISVNVQVLATSFPGTLHHAQVAMLKFKELHTLRGLFGPLCKAKKRSFFPVISSYSLDEQKPK